MGKTTSDQHPEQVMQCESRQVTVHTFSMGDVEDPDIWAAQPLSEWQESESGQWVMQNATEPPVWHRTPDAFGLGYRYSVTASFQGQALTEWLLRYGSR